MSLSVVRQYDHGGLMNAELDQMLSAIQEWANREMGGKWKRQQLSALSPWTTGAGTSFTPDSALSRYFKYLKQGPRVDVHFDIVGTFVGAPTGLQFDLPSEIVIPDISFGKGTLDTGAGLVTMDILAVPANYGGNPRQRAYLSMSRTDAVAFAAGQRAVYGSFSFEVAQ